MASAESFVTAAQQLLTQPLPGRAHYGRSPSCLSQLLCFFLLPPVPRSCSGSCLPWCFGDPRSDLEESSHFTAQPEKRCNISLQLWASQLQQGKQPTHKGSWHRCKVAVLSQKILICLPRQSKRSSWSALPRLLHASISNLTSTKVPSSPFSTMWNGETQTRILMWKLLVIYVPEILGNKDKKVLLWWLQRVSLHKSSSP